MLSSSFGQKKASLRFLILIWITAIGVGLFSLLEYSSKEGESADFTTSRWPEQSSLTPPNDQFARFVVFLHPRCPCSRATVTELERLTLPLRKSTKITAVFIKPEGRSEKWVRTTLWKRLSKNSHIELKIDDGNEMKVFGANTSGQSYLFDHTGRLVFKGGITQARGHEGDSVGRERILSWLKSKNRSPAGLDTLTTEKTTETRVYGCALRSKSKESETNLK